MSRMNEIQDALNERITGPEAASWAEAAGRRRAIALVLIDVLDEVRVALMQREHSPADQALDVLERFDAEWLGGEQR